MMHKETIIEIPSSPNPDVHTKIIQNYDQKGTDPWLRQLIIMTLVNPEYVPENIVNRNKNPLELFAAATYHLNTHKPSKVSIEIPSEPLNKKTVGLRANRNAIRRIKADPLLDIKQLREISIQEQDKIITAPTPTQALIIFLENQLLIPLQGAYLEITPSPPSPIDNIPTDLNF